MPNSKYKLMKDSERIYLMSRELGIKREQKPKDTKAKDQDGAVSSLTEKLKGSHISSGKGS